MNLDKITPSQAEGEINVVIEISMNGYPIKYEFDKDARAIFVDRFMQVAMSYPANYGFIPHTLSEDGDPVDVLVITQYPVMPSSILRARPIGVLLMEDESGKDEKIIAVPVTKLDVTYENVRDINDIHPVILQRITHFFERYKDLEKGKWVKVTGFESAAVANNLIQEGISRIINLLDE